MKTKVFKKRAADLKGMEAKALEKAEKHRGKDVDRLHSHLAMMRPLIPKLAIAERNSAISKENWVSVGKKDLKETAIEETNLTLLKKELGLIRATARTAFGNRPVRFHAPMDFTITTTVTSGVTKTVLMGGSTALAASNLTEWTSLAALFDEVKVHGGLVDCIYNNPTPVSAALTTDSRPIMGFDPADATAAASGSAVSQLAQHKTFPAIMGSTGYGGHYKFRFEVPKGTFSDPASSFCGDVWQPTSGPVAVGAVKFFHIGGVVTAIVTGGGQLFLDVSFRCRE